ncbi:MAG: YeeE/YedE family protein [Rhodobacterales bacterium]|nr:YeeE/YedE family protein [Rhodobacterales bacterium]
MLATLGFEMLSPRTASVVLGLVLGLAFGLLAEPTRFCLRRGLAGPARERRPALALWLMALAVALAGTQAAVAAGLGLGTLAAGAALRLLVPAAWVGTGWLLADEFDPIPLESLSMILPSAETLFWTIAASAVPAAFGTGLIGGIVAGALAASTLGGRFGWQSFSSAAETGRYLAGAVLMGLGGVLAGGCTLGAGLAGLSSLSLAGGLAMAGIVLGARLTDRAISGNAAGSAAPPTTRPA